MENLKEKLISIELKISSLEDEKKQFMSYYKDNLKPLKCKKQEILREIGGEPR